MAVEDTAKEGFGSSSLPDPTESKSATDVPSPDDLAWADSCLVKESELADSSWDSLKDALLNMLNSEPSSQSFYAAESGDSLPEAANQTPPGKSISSGEEMEQNSEFTELFEDIKESVSDTRLASPFRPNYSEDRKVIVEEDDYGMDFGSLVIDTEPSIDDIFKVWDLETPTDDDDEEEELVKQLNKVLAGGESSSLTSSSTLELNSVDDIVAGISDLSLDKISS